MVKKQIIGLEDSNAVSALCTCMLSVSSTKIINETISEILDIESGYTPLDSILKLKLSSSLLDNGFYPIENKKTYTFVYNNLNYDFYISEIGETSGKTYIKIYGKTIDLKTFFNNNLSIRELEDGYSVDFTSNFQLSEKESYPIPEFFISNIKSNSVLITILNKEVSEMSYKICYKLKNDNTLNFKDSTSNIISLESLVENSLYEVSVCKVYSNYETSYFSNFLEFKTFPLE